MLNTRNAKPPSREASADATSKRKWMVGLGIVMLLALLLVAGDWLITVPLVLIGLFIALLIRQRKAPSNRRLWVIVLIGSALLIVLVALILFGMALSDLAFDV